jgi:3-dehydroquinate synthase II
MRRGEDRKEVMIHLPQDCRNKREIVERALAQGFRLLLCKEIPEELKGLRGFTLYCPSDGGDVRVVSPDQIQGGDLGRGFAVQLELREKRDERKAIEAGVAGAEAILVETADWKIIPLENLVAELQKSNTKIFTRIDRVEEVKTMFKVLERGVDGVIFTPKRPEDIDALAKEMEGVGRIELSPAEVVEKRDIWSGDRVCIDTASLMREGEGMLLGSQANVLFLVCGETLGSKFSAPRPFRVNAGPVHSYILLPDGKTKYLSELECGDEVLVLDGNGKPRRAVVGRVKIEERPLTLVKVRCGDIMGKILVQNAETIRFMAKKGAPIPVTELNAGDEVLVHLRGTGGRHFGTQVDEFMIER